MPFRSLLLVSSIPLLAAANLCAATVDEHLLSGSKFIQDKKYKDATREFETAVSLAPENADANRLLGLSLVRSGELDRATEYSLKAARLEPSYPAYYNLGLIYANQEKYERAADAYTQALELNPKSYEAWHQLGKVFATTLQFDKAVEAYSKAAQLNPKFPDAYQGLASAHYWTGNLAVALEQVDQLTKLGFAEKASQLEKWIKDKEAKKKKSSRLR